MSVWGLGFTVCTLLIAAMYELGLRVWGLQGYLAHKKTPPPQNRPRTIGIGLL